MSSYRASTHDDAARKRALDVWEQRVQTVTAPSKDRATPAKSTQKKQKSG